TEESFNTTLNINSSGNLRLIKLPELELSNSMEVYDPERKENIQTTASGMRGSVEQTYTIIPQKPGKYPIGPVTFSYFDPNSETYKTLRSEEFQLKVEPSSTISSTVSRGTDTPRNVLSEVDQFKFISLDTKLRDIKPKQTYLQKAGYWIVLSLSFLAIPILILIGRWRNISLADTERNRLREADKLARRYLGKAKKKQADKEAFYEALELALHNFLKAK